jgi:hypothetical protein
MHQRPDPKPDDNIDHPERLDQRPDKLCEPLRLWRLMGIPRSRRSPPLGRDARLWDGGEGIEERYDIEAVSSPSDITHLTFTRR